MKYGISKLISYNKYLLLPLNGEVGWDQMKYGNN